MDVGWDGSFEVYVGGVKRGPNWLPTTLGSRKLFIRQGFDDWSELPARMRIERIGMDAPRPMPQPTEMIEAMNWAGTFLAEMMTDWPDWTFEFADSVGADVINSFPGEQRKGDPVYTPQLDKKRGRTVANMYWKLPSYEALIVEFDASNIFRMLTNMGALMTSMDYLYRPVSYSPARSQVDSDGKIRMILAHEDPGYHNWIDTQRFECGHLVSRNNLTSESTEFRTKLVKHAELVDHLPTDSVRVTPRERVEQMQMRIHSILRRYAL